jgi:hypothetical protein
MKQVRRRFCLACSLCVDSNHDKKLPIAYLLLGENTSYEIGLGLGGTSHRARVYWRNELEPKGNGICSLPISVFDSGTLHPAFRNDIYEAPTPISQSQTSNRVRLTGGEP